MKDKDVRIGMKVVPFQKTVKGYSAMGDCTPSDRAKKQGFMYVVGHELDLSCWVLDDGNQNSLNKGAFFNSCDFEPYEEYEPKKLEKLTYAISGYSREERELIVKINKEHNELLNKVASLEAENERLKAEREWQPIETAPKDGTPLWLWNEGNNNGYWFSTSGGGGFWVSHAIEIFPTHWMLPRPPEEK